MYKLLRADTCRTYWNSNETIPFDSPVMTSSFATNHNAFKPYPQLVSLDLHLLESRHSFEPAR
jgi:hypothetical protein